MIPLAELSIGELAVEPMTSLTTPSKHFTYHEPRCLRGLERGQQPQGSAAALAAGGSLPMELQR